MTPELRTDRLVLSPYTRSDESDFVAFFGDQRVGQWFGDDSPDEIRGVFERVFSLVYAEDRFKVWAVRHEGRYIGHAEIKPSPESWLDGQEIVYGLTAASWGQGFGSELVRALTSYGYDELGLSEVHATVDARNAASLGVLKKAGYVHVRDVPEDDGTTTQLLTHRRL
ncbi:GNAT family N-acetyltransferase [Streptomyces apocyni]|uniref:GNAT family N-acetyltransferase n=1 Tax=Streptomyces apocyni TaxID=2654677 RepID=UPI0012EA840F|nr:GNAT family N-acetyltransferase [Streptomyces apocyni]